MTIDITKRVNAGLEGKLAISYAGTGSISLDNISLLYS